MFLLRTCPPQLLYPFLTSLLGRAGLKSCLVEAGWTRWLTQDPANFPTLSPCRGVPETLGNIGVSWISAFGIDTNFHPFLGSCHGKAEECIGLCRALLSALHWLLRCTAASAERLQEGLEAATPATGEKQLALCLQCLEKTLSSTKNRALLHIAKLEEACMSPDPPAPCLLLLLWLVL